MRFPLLCFLVALPLFSRPQIMIASWYGPRHAGKKMANGEKFDPKAMTCASRILPLGQILKLRIGPKTTFARVTDRGPWLNGRDLDLSEAVAEALGMKRWGVAFVEVEAAG